jgi:hypothetical protein
MQQFHELLPSPSQTAKENAAQMGDNFGDWVIKNSAIKNMPPQRKYASSRCA